ncbi:MAG TPA: hypothetical protein VFH68_06460 [Polyangia bacterium]|nr:hypothetical protein [Polyangia bacterium]
MSASGLIACSVLVNRDTRQCSAEADCKRLPGGSASTCDVARGVCMALPRVGVEGCIPPGPGLTPEQLPNVCTDVACVPFHNAAHGLKDGDDSPLVTPDGGAPVSASDAGTTTVDAGTVQLPPCLSPADGRENVIYITGSSNFPPLLAKLGPFIIRTTGYTPVYQITSSCNGVKSIFSTVARERMIADPAAALRTARATYVTDRGLLVACSLPAGGVNVDVGESDIFSSSCADSGEPPADVGEYFGPIQAMIFAVPNTSTQDVISAEMARAVFGKGGDNGKGAPWIEPRSYFVRNANTGTQQLIGRAINVAADRFWGTDYGTAANLKSQLEAVALERAEQSIGIISSDYYNPTMNSFKELAFQGFGQLCGFWPDSSQYVGDKRNVRDGHYPIWGPLHFFTRLNGAGAPSSPAAAAFVLNTSIAEPDTEVLNAFIDASLVPSCAMRVQRSKADLAPLTPYTPPIGCGCYFDARVSLGVVPPECQECKTSQECPASRPACRLGYCEAT